MSKTKTYTIPLTLRLSPGMMEYVDEQAREKGITSVDWVRFAIAFTYWEQDFLGHVAEEEKKEGITDRGDKGLDRGVVDLIRLNPLGVGIVGETREAEMGAPTRQLSHQSSPCRAQRRFGRALDGLQAADLYRGEEARAEVGEGLGADPHRNRVDARQLCADRRQIERDAGRIVLQQAGDPLHRRVQVPQPGSGKRGLVLQGDEEVRQGDRRGIGGTVGGALRLTLVGHLLGPFGKPGLGQEGSRDDSRRQRVTFGNPIIENMGRLFD
jgi:hypothetical protein